MYFFGWGHRTVPIGNAGYGISYLRRETVSPGSAGVSLLSPVLDCWNDSKQEVSSHLLTVRDAV